MSNNKFNQRFPQAGKTTAPSAADLDAVAAEQKAKEATTKFGEQGLGQNPETGCISNEELALRSNPPVAPSKEQLEKLAAEFKNSFGGNARKGMRTLPNGSIVVEVTIDVDLANSLISWAEGAGENPAEYIQKQVGEALLAYMGS